jgi:hypothetical protein
MPADKPEKVYERLVSAVFERHYKKGVKSFEFERAELEDLADKMSLKLPKNIGDVIYSFRYRRHLPEQIVAAAAKGNEWVIEGAGRSKYIMKQVKSVQLTPREDMLEIKIPDSTPEIIAMYAQGDEQALLAKVRYNRLVDVFLGITSYSLQNHLRTTVKGMGQIEIDEIYVAIDRSGVQYIVPVQAKGGKDMHSSVQTKQDILCCRAKFPDLVCRAVSAQFMESGTIAMFEMALVEDEIKVVREKQYLLVPSAMLSSEDLKRYRAFSEAEK